MKIRVTQLEKGKEPVISHVWCIYETESCVILCVDLHKKYQEPSGYQGESVWFGNECLTVDDLPFFPTIKAETARYTAVVTLVDSQLLSKEPDPILWQDKDGYHENH